MHTLILRHFESRIAAAHSIAELDQVSVELQHVWEDEDALLLRSQLDSRRAELVQEASTGGEERLV